MKIAITGASGFIGNRVVERFYLQDNLEVVPVVHSNSSLALPARFQLPWKVCDHSRVDELAAAFEGCDVVVHAAFGGNLAESANALYRAADRAGVQRIVVLSSASIYNQIPEPGTTESSPLPERPSTLYNAAKIKADEAMLKCRSRGQTEIVFLLPGIVFGPRSFWITRVFKQARAGRAALINGGSGVCNSVYVDNLVEAIRLCLRADNIDNESFFISDTELVTWADFYEPIVASAGLDLKHVHQFAPPAYSPVSRKDQLAAKFYEFSESPAIASIKPRVPWRAKLLYKSLIGIAGASKPDENARFAFDGGLQPEMADDMVLLQQCTYKLPNDKAEKMLNYRPIVSFHEGMQRSINWLEFAGYPVVNVSSRRVQVNG